MKMKMKMTMKIRKVAPAPSFWRFVPFSPLQVAQTNFVFRSVSSHRNNEHACYGGKQCRCDWLTDDRMLPYAYCHTQRREVHRSKTSDVHPVSGEHLARTGIWDSRHGKVENASWASLISSLPTIAYHHPAQRYLGEAMLRAEKKFSSKLTSEFMWISVKCKERACTVQQLLMTFPRMEEGSPRFAHHNLRLGFLGSKRTRKKIPIVEHSIYASACGVCSKHFGPQPDLRL